MYSLEIGVYETQEEIDWNQGYKYYFSGIGDVCRTNDLATMVMWLKEDLIQIEHDK